MMPNPDVDKLYSYYRVVDPKIDLDTGQRFLFTPKGKTGGEQEEIKAILATYIENCISGNNIVTDAKLKAYSKGGLFFNTAHQKQQETKYLEQNDYWTYLNDKNTLAPVGNYYNQVCAASGQPPMEFSINVLRSPLLTPARRNVDEISLFLNYMPSIFASKMVPYFDVEFEIPNEKLTSDAAYFLNKPSLLRFLLGSVNVGKNGLPLTAADKSLIQTISTPALNASEAESHFLGMEFFTTPQTLYNMEENKASRSSRVVDPKPFLPPATIISADLQAANAGAGVFVHTTGNLVLKIHDKNRMTEFADFLRGGPGFRPVTVWLTYGWLAPRSNTDEDVYAQFINTKMLERRAFTVKNAQFSFDASGSVTVTIELVSKAINSIQTNSLNAAYTDPKDQTNNGKAFEAGLKRLGELVKRVKKGRSLFGDPPEGMEEMRFFQIINAAAEGQLVLDIEPAQIKSTLNATIKALEDENKSRIKGSDRSEAIAILENLKVIYTDPSVIGKLKKDVYDYTKSRLQACYSGSPDPFLAIEQKNKYFGNDLTSVVKKFIDGGNLFKAVDQQAAVAEEEIEVPVLDSNGIPQLSPDGKKQLTQKIRYSKKKHPVLPGQKEIKNNVVSFGKLFSVFCMPSLLTSCDAEGVDELQINFYQFNDSCGPLSYHNIAEFPIDVRLLIIQFQHLIERRGSPVMTLQEFLQFVMMTQIADMRSPGYDMSDQYEPYKSDKLEETKNKEYESKMSAWLIKYGEFKRPNVVMYSETLNSGDPSDKNNIDLLKKIGSTVGSYYSEKVEKREGQKKIKRVHIYDKTASPHSTKAKRILKSDEAGSKYIAVDEKDLPAFAKSMSPLNVLGGLTERVLGVSLGQSAPRPDVISVTGGKDVLRNFISNTVPTIEIGCNGSLVKSVSLASKTDGYIGVMNLQGGSGRANSDLTDDGTKSFVNNLPMRVVPAQLTLSTVGCPIANLYQQFFVNLDTGTTLDNIYSATGIQHSFGPGKFETSWTMAYYDGYGKFFGAAPLGATLAEIIKPPPPPPPPNNTKGLSQAEKAAIAGFVGG